MNYTTINPQTVLNLGENYTSHELMTKYLITLSKYLPKDNINNDVYNENIFLINRSFILLAPNCDFKEIDSQRYKIFMNYLGNFIIKYYAYRVHKNDNYFESTMKQFSSIYKKIKVNKKNNTKLKKI